MKILLSMLHFGLLRNFESLVEELSARGHEVVLLADEREDLGGQALAERLAARPRVSWQLAPAYDGEPWFRVARKLRQGLDYLRFLEPAYRDFPKLRERAAERTPGLVTSAARLEAPLVNRLLRRAFARVESGLPRHPATDDLLRTMRPDVALFASVTNSRAPQLDHLRSAAAAGIPTGVCVYSWDHLSSKSLVRVLPDRMFVWNDTQREEAVTLHGMPRGRVVVTGAQVYDQWFGRQPTRTRAQLLADHGLPADRELLLYVCSALTPDPGESRYVRQWIEGVRRSDDLRVRTAAVIIRPHPERRREWEGLDWGAAGPVRIAGENPLSTGAKNDYFDSLSHSLAVVGLVTSAFLEAAIADRPVLSIEFPELQRHQRGMLHFRYLLEVGDGLLTMAADVAAHVRQLEQIGRGELAWRDRQRRFLRAFVRPHGLQQQATPLFADAVESLAAARSTVVVPREPQPWQRALTAKVITAADRGLLRSLFLDAREREEDVRRRRALAQHRRERRDKWRRHRQQKLSARVRWHWQRARQTVSLRAPRDSSAPKHD